MKDNTEVTKDLIIEMIKKGLTIEEVIDAVIDYNGIIGVGLISLGQHLYNHCKKKINTSLT